MFAAQVPRAFFAIAEKGVPTLPESLRFRAVFAALSSGTTYEQPSSNAGTCAAPSLAASQLPISPPYRTGASLMSTRVTVMVADELVRLPPSSLVLSVGFDHTVTSSENGLFAERTS